MKWKYIEWRFPFFTFSYSSMIVKVLFWSQILIYLFVFKPPESQSRTFSIWSVLLFVFLIAFKENLQKLFNMFLFQYLVPNFNHFRKEIGFICVLQSCASVSENLRALWYTQVCFSITDWFQSSSFHSTLNVFFLYYRLFVNAFCLNLLN